MKKSIIVFLLIFTASYSQISGCTDSLSKNFNPNATTNNGSCLYKSTKTKTITSLKLNDSLKETSGLVVFDSLFWTHNDDHDTNFYGIDSSGKILKKIKLEDVINSDWEDISQDSTYLYIGDFGNNYQGNRTDLHILRIEKKSFLLNKPVIDTISFSYSDQRDFSTQKSNSTDFDCEAFVVSQDSIYLFTKQWNKKKSSIYVLPKTPGNYKAQFKETLNAKGLVTGATDFASKNQIVLCGYTKKLKPFLYLIYDLNKYNFSKANQRKINLALPFHQIEGITTSDGKLFYVTNESFVKKPIANTPQQIHSIDLSSFLKN